jgi:hypothetical protein
MIDKLKSLLIEFCYLTWNLQKKYIYVFWTLLFSNNGPLTLFKFQLVGSTLPVGEASIPGWPLASPSATPRLFVVLSSLLVVVWRVAVVIVVILEAWKNASHLYRRQSTMDWTIFRCFSAGYNGMFYFLITVGAA